MQRRHFRFFSRNPISPHKFVGGPGTPGVLVAKKKLFRVTLHFTKLVERGRDASVGAARVSLRDGAIVEWKATTHEDRALVERLWGAFRARHPRISNRLRTRRQKLTELARHHPASASRTRTRAAKLGRNDPCTCGSGKKYKRCCGK